MDRKSRKNYIWLLIWLMMISLLYMVLYLGGEDYVYAGTMKFGGLRQILFGMSVCSFLYPLIELICLAVRHHKEKTAQSE